MLINEEERKKKENLRSSEKNGADEKESQLSWCDVKWKLGEKVAELNKCLDTLVQA
jgi:hypothetical protein